MIRIKRFKAKDNEKFKNYINQEKYKNYYPNEIKLLFGYSIFIWTKQN